MIAALLPAACGAPVPRPPAGSVDTLPGGAWSLGARAPDGALLVAPEDPSTGVIPVLHWRPADPPARSGAGVLRVTLPGEAAAGPVRLGRGRLAGDPVLFGIPHAGPTPVGIGDGEYLLEAAGTLWTVSAAGEARRLVPDTDGRWDRRVLEARQREGEVILYWAAVPVPSPDGSQVAFATNREAVAANRRGQSVWLLDRRTGQTRPLIRRIGQWYRPEGWLGEELVFTGGFAGVRAVHPASGRSRTVSDGLLVAASPDGGALAVALDVPDSTRIRVLWEGRIAEVPPPEGTLFAPQGVFAPDGRRLLLQASTRDGLTRTFGVLDLSGDPPLLRWIDLPAPPSALDRWPVWLDDRTLLVTTAERRGGPSGSYAVTVP